MAPILRTFFILLVGILFVESAESTGLRRKRVEFATDGKLSIGKVEEIQEERTQPIRPNSDHDQLDEDLRYLLANIEFSVEDMSFPTFAPSSFPTSSTPSSSNLAPAIVTTVCDPNQCPCCSMPEFIRTIERFSGGTDAACQGQDCCMTRGNDVFLVDCETPSSNIPPGYGVAYMCYQYTEESSPQIQTSQCGDSAFGDPLWITITSNEEAAACDALIRSKISDVANCNVEWPCY